MRVIIRKCQGQKNSEGWQNVDFRISVTFDGFEAELTFHVDADSNAGFYSIEKRIFHYL
jgi:hypothetical protein